MLSLEERRQKHGAKVLCTTGHFTARCLLHMNAAPAPKQALYPQGKGRFPRGEPELSTSSLLLAPPGLRPPLTHRAQRTSVTPSHVEIGIVFGFSILLLAPAAFPIPQHTHRTQHMPVPQRHFLEMGKNNQCNHMLYPPHRNSSTYSNLWRKPASCLRRKDWGSRRLP